MNERGRKTSKRQALNGGQKSIAWKSGNIFHFDGIYLAGGAAVVLPRKERKRSAGHLTSGCRAVFDPKRHVAFTGASAAATACSLFLGAAVVVSRGRRHPTGVHLQHDKDVRL